MASVRVNGELRDVPLLDRNLLSFLRYDCGLTGAKYGCGEGLCGACTVLVDGQPIRSCTSTVGSVAGGVIVTIEGLADGDDLHPVQRAFVEESAMQCGYCIPGFVMAAVWLLDREPGASAERIREALGGQICRCGTYQRIQRAIERAAAQGAAS